MLGNSIALLAIAAYFGVEAFKHRANRPALIIFGLLTALIIGVAATLPALTVAYPKVGAFISGAFDDPSSWLLIAVGLFFVSRPLWTAKLAEADTAPVEPPENDSLTADDVEAIASDQRLATLEEGQKSLAEIEARLKKSEAAADKLRFEYDLFAANFEPTVDRMFAALRDEFKAEHHDLARELRRGATQAQKDQDAFQKSMETWVGTLQRQLRLGLRGLDQGFSALLDRERLLELAASIQDVGDELSAPTDGKPLGEWKEWQTKYTAWHRNVDTWARLADKHRHGVIARVFDTPRSEYKGKWKADWADFPDADAIEDYKTFRIISRNFHVERKNVDYALLLAAFGHPSMKYRGNPDDDDDPMLTLPPPPEDYRD